MSRRTPTLATSSRTSARSRSESNSSSMSARMRSRGDTRVDTGVGSFLCLQGFERNLRPSSIYTGDRTPPSGACSVSPVLYNRAMLVLREFLYRRDDLVSQFLEQLEGGVYGPCATNLGRRVRML